MMTFPSKPSSRFFQCAQRSDEWFAVRAGKVTASEIHRVMSKRINGGGRPLQKRIDYIHRIVAEIMTGKPQANAFVNEAMEWGVMQEDVSRRAYEAISGNTIEPMGFVIHPAIDRAGCSPDGLVGTDGMVQFKNPTSPVHIAYLFAGKMPVEYVDQVQMELACCEREWSDFVSFDSRMPREQQMFRLRVNRDDKRISEIDASIIELLAKVDELLHRLGWIEPKMTPRNNIEVYCPIKEGAK